jgi:anti-anti-sigma factor
VTQLSEPGTDDASRSAQPTVSRQSLPDGVLVYRVAGEFDMDGADLLVFDETAARASCIILDLDGLTFCDSCGLNALLRLRLAAAGRGIPVHLAAVSERVTRLLEVTGADQVFPVHADLDDAVTAVRS